MDHEVHHAHPDASTYVKIAVILGVITVVEVALHYLPLSYAIVVPALLVLTIAKFAGVVMYYMHLKYDARLLSGLFLWGMFVATSIIIAVLAMYQLTVFL